MALPKLMKAARFRPDTKKVEIQEVAVPKPDDDLILVRTIGSGLCHSDMVLCSLFLPLSCPITDIDVH